MIFKKLIKAGPIKFRLTEMAIEASANNKGYKIPVGKTGPDEMSFSDESRVALMAQLNQAHNKIRLDYLTGAVSIALSIYLFNQNSLLGMFSIIGGIVLTVITTIWEIKRRTVMVSYDFSSESSRIFDRVISAFNYLSTSRRIWAIEGTQGIYNAHESKLNAGASQVVSELSVEIGQGNPPWINTNINVPAIMMKKCSIFFMPDGIYLYDNKCVDFTRYENVTVSHNTTHFIDEKPPIDAKILNYTWRYPNKSGGPDHRFNNNYEIPVCLYGELNIEMKSKYYIHLMTSRYDSSSKFYREYVIVKRML